MTLLLVQLFENLNLSSSYERLSPHQIWFNLDQGKLSYGAPPTQIENILNHQGEIAVNGHVDYSSWQAAHDIR